VHRLHKRQFAASPPSDAVHILRVLLEPTRALGVDTHIAWNFDDGSTCGLHIRNCVACPTDGTGASITISSTPAMWIDIVTGATTITDAIKAGDVRVAGNTPELLAALDSFEVAGLRTSA
jgi:alkyl sulfatase BDS1-like metallo-beta-lactamase superfamily hydrolase